MIKTACPLDCYDACSVVFEDKKLKGDKSHPVTRGFLCPHLNRYLDHERINSARYQGEAISLSEALGVLVQELKKSDPAKTLLYRGSGNVGRMQQVSDLFFARFGATLTEGSLCDGAGEYGVVKGRGASLVLPPGEIEKSEVVILWGRNPTVTNSHFLPLLKDKTVIVIDPVKTDIAKRAHLHLQIKPRSDLYLAALICRFAFMEGMEDREFLENKTKNQEAFYHLLHTIRIEEALAKTGLYLDAIGTLLCLLKGKKTAILVGVGVQKYSIGSDVLRMIDGLGAVLGLFGKPGCGVSFLGDSGFGFDNPFAVQTRRVPKPTVDFSQFDLALIQGANPAAQMPSTSSVVEGLKKCGFVVYFGLYENETSALADLVIPAKNFLEKQDVRLSYGHEYVSFLPKILQCDDAISEYELTQYLFASFGYEGLKPESTYIETFRSQTVVKEGFLISPAYQKPPYSEGFATEDQKFHFLDAFNDGYNEEEGLWLLTAKSLKSLNSQFRRDPYLYLHPSLGYGDGQMVLVTSRWGLASFSVRLSPDIRPDCVLIHSGAPGVNRLTPPRMSDHGKNPIYQEVKVQIKKA